MTCITKEYLHKPQSTLEAGGDLGIRLRGGSTTADHVDILGNSELLTDILLIATGNDDQVQDRVLSKIQEISECYLSTKLSPEDFCIINLSPYFSYLLHFFRLNSTLKSFLLVYLPMISNN